MPLFSLVLDRLFVILLIAVPTAMLMHGPGSLSPAGPKVQAAAFGVLMPVDSCSGDDVVFVQTDEVPLVDGTRFGWRALLSPNVTGPLTVREELILPAAPAQWGVSSDTVLSADRRVAVTERVVTPRDGFIGNGWSITDGDPKGVYEIRVFLDDHLAERFRFLVR